MSTRCVVCDEPTAEAGQGLPINSRCDVMHNHAPGEWAGTPACENCYKMHTAICNATPSTVNVDHIMMVYAETTQALRGQLQDARKALVAIRESVDNSLNVIGEP